MESDDGFPKWPEEDTGLGGRGKGEKGVGENLAQIMEHDASEDVEAAVGSKLLGHGVTDDELNSSVSDQYPKAESVKLAESVDSFGDHQHDVSCSSSSVAGEAALSLEIVIDQGSALSSEQDSDEEKTISFVKTVDNPVTEITKECDGSQSVAGYGLIKDNVTNDKVFGNGGDSGDPKATPEKIEVAQFFLGLASAQEFDEHLQDSQSMDTPISPEAGKLDFTGAVIIEQAVWTPELHQSLLMRRLTTHAPLQEGDQVAQEANDLQQGVMDERYELEKSTSNESTEKEYTQAISLTGEIVAVSPISEQAGLLVEAENCSTAV